MRTEKEVMELVIGVSQKDERIRLVTLEGSRTNPSIPDDPFKDYDVSFFVTDMESYKESDSWLDVFGERLILQKPEAMALYPAELGGWFSYLMLFEDEVKLDLTLIPVEDTEEYFAHTDGLVQVLLDKDGRITEKVVPTDKQYWIQPPTAQQFDDCCNEFWWVSTYVAKGLARGEFLFAVDHLHNMVRPALLQMMAWKIGFQKGFTFSLGKNHKFLDKHVSSDVWNELLETYNTAGAEATWQALFRCQRLFRRYSMEVAQSFDWNYPEYDEKVTPYIKKLHAL